MPLDLDALPDALDLLANRIELRRFALAGGLEKLATEWRTAATPSPNKALQTAKRLAASLDGDEWAATVAALRDGPDRAANLRALGTLLRLTAEADLPAALDAVGAEAADALDAAALDVLFVNDLLRIRLAVHAARGAAWPAEGEELAERLRSLKRPPPGERAARHAVFDDLARLQAWEVERLFIDFPRRQLALALTDAPSAALNPAIMDNVRANLPQVAHRVLDDDLAAAKRDADPVTVREARRAVCDWLDSMVRRCEFGMPADGWDGK